MCKITRRFHKAMTMRRRPEGASAQEDRMSHYENLVQGAPSIMYYFGKYDLVSSIIYKTRNGSHISCMQISRFTST
jgi:hypothetical protein